MNTNFWQLFFDLKSLTNNKPFDPEEWEENPPRLLRYQMLMSICSCLGIELKEIDSESIKVEMNKDTICGFLEELILKTKRKQKGKDYQFILDTIKKDNKLSVNENYIYSKLFQMRYNLHQINVQFGGVIAASGLYVLPIILNNEIIRKTREELVTIDQLLMLFINPKGEDLSRERLIRDFNFPVEDIHNVDFDYI
jgi:hypothetical protein